MDYPINMKIGDENFTQLLDGYQATFQGKKNTITALRKLIKRSGKDIFFITKNDAETFYDSCISDIHNGTYKPLYIKTVMHSLKAFYKYVNDLSQNGSLDQTFPCCCNGSPFCDIIIDIPDKLEYQETDFPSMESIDTLLSLCPTASLKAAVCLALKMCLTISDISTLKKNQIIIDDDNKMYIRFVSVTELGEYPRYLLVPNDLHTMILQLYNSTDASYEYLLISRRHTPCAVRTLEHALNKIVKENNLGNNLTFSSLRNMGIRILLNNGALPQEVADYLGIQGKWLSRYEKVPPYLVKDMNKYSNIEIKQNIFEQ
ncbi:MAG: site-specific integrase [Lachnospiraceae bacterium]|nr:site-specific integrase [Lachnospiraceae bacterium]